MRVIEGYQLIDEGVSRDFYRNSETGLKRQLGFSASLLTVMAEEAPQTITANDLQTPSTQDMVLETPQTITANDPQTPSTQDMVLETASPAADQTHAAADSSNGGEENSKREKEDGKEDNGGGKKPRVDDVSAEEERLEVMECDEGGEKEEEGKVVGLGPKSFGSGVEMFDYFFKLLHYWPPNLNVNKYEHMVLLELLKKGHLEPEKKIGEGILAFQVRYHPEWKSRCFFLVRNDESVDDFSFRKCVDHILPLPENMQIKSDVNKALGGGGRGHGGRGGGGGRGGRGGGHGRGRGGGGRFRGGRSRN